MTGLVTDTPHSVRDCNGRRWPKLDGIPFLRADRDELAQEALARLDAGDREGALVLLLADQDDWWRGPIADAVALRELVRYRDHLSLREAMALLAWGPVADYFAHRWSDPTFLAGLALTEAHWNDPETAFELACGIGHHLRELSRCGVAAVGADVVFAKLWIAHHFVAPAARLICFDAAQAWPAFDRFDLVLCHDAFYFLEPKAEILQQLRELLQPSHGVLLISHVHNRDWPNLSSGSAVTAHDMASLFPEALFYDDADLTQALVAEQAPFPATSPLGFSGVEAFAAASGPGLHTPYAIRGSFGLPPVGASLRRNPLYDQRGVVIWPSDRYEHEYGPRATYPAQTQVPERITLDASCLEQARRRELLDLPERW